MKATAWCGSGVTLDPMHRAETYPGLWQLLLPHEPRLQIPRGDGCSFFHTPRGGTVVFIVVALVLALVIADFVDMSGGSKTG